MKYTVFNVNVFGEYERVQSFRSQCEAESFLSRKWEELEYGSKAYDLLTIEVEGVDHD